MKCESCGADAEQIATLKRELEEVRAVAAADYARAERWRELAQHRGELWEAAERERLREDGGEPRKAAAVLRLVKPGENSVDGGSDCGNSVPKEGVEPPTFGSRVTCSRLRLPRQVEVTRAAA